MFSQCVSICTYMSCQSSKNTKCREIKFAHAKIEVKQHSIPRVAALLEVCTISSTHHPLF